MKEKIDQAGYNLQLLRKQRRRACFRVALRYSILVLCLVVIAAGTADYFARLPRERAAKNFSYLKRVQLGLETAYRAVTLKLNEHPADPKNTQLPIFEIFIKGKRLDKLSEKLPESGEKDQKAKVKFEDKEFDAMVRFRGDSINHWAFPQKSWRVSLEKGKFFEGMQSFNLTVPRVETQISNWLGYKMAEQFDDLLVPYADFVHFRLNRRFDGVRMLLEQPNQDFLRKRNLPYGKIFVGDIDSQQIYGDTPRKAIYRDVSAWQVRGPGEDVLTSEMADLVDVIKNEFNPYKLFDRMQNLVDMPAMLEYMALLELVGSVHVDETHNGKYYFNPVTGKFQPIVWDTVAYMWKNSKGLDLGTNSLFRAVLGIPEWREQKDRYLWNAINGKLSTQEIQSMIKRQVKAMRADIYAFGLKLHANDKGIRHVSNDEWEQSIRELLEVVEQRNKTISDALQNGEGAYRLQRVEDGHYRLALQIKSAAGARINKISLTPSKVNELAQVRISRRGIEDIGHALAPDAQLTAQWLDGALVFSPSDELFSKRRFARGGKPELVPATYVYDIFTPGALELNGVKSIDASNSITSSAFAFHSAPELEISPTHKQNNVWWTPERFVNRSITKLSGVKHLTESLVLDRYSSLELEPGATLKLDPGVSIILQGGALKALGTEMAPIVIESASLKEPWGALALNGAEVEMDHVLLKGGSETHFKHVYYQAPLSLNNSKASIRNSKIIGSYIAVKGSQLALENSQIENPFSFHLLVENSRVQESKVEHKQVQPMHSKALITVADARGTPPRAEREFKYTLVIPDSMKVDMGRIASGIQKALEVAVKDGSLWRAPRFAGNDFYADQAAEDFAFRDIYFDTPGNLNYKNQISYRFRNRYQSIPYYEAHIKNQQWTERWPHRLEFQAKIGREELGDGFSTVDEARFEFRKESKPFSETKLPPPAPWDLDEFITHFQLGEYKGIPTMPGQVVMKTLFPEGVAATDLKFEPRLVLVTERIRQHMNIKSPWGSGPNPEQSYIISLDHSQVYDAGPYLRFLRARKFGDKEKKAPPLMGDIVEIELEYERNVSDVLDKKIAEALSKGDSETVQYLSEARDAFLADQKTIMKVIQKYFAEKEELELMPAQKSKYVQAFEMAALSGLPKR